MKNNQNGLIPRREAGRRHSSSIKINATSRFKKSASDAGISSNLFYQHGYL
jgi:hypothetical protein